MTHGHKRIFWKGVLVLISLLSLALPLPFKDRLSIMIALLALASIVLTKALHNNRSW